MEELLEYEIESILLSRVRDVFSHHQRIAVACDAFRNAVSSSLKKKRDRKHDYTRKMEENASIIANTTSQMTHVQNELATVALQQKVLEKQIHNVLVQQKNVREEIDAGIAEKDGLALEMVDLEQDLAKCRESKKRKWDGVKRVVRAYKSALQLAMYITDSSEACDKVRLIFFKREKNDNAKYYVDLTRTSDSWRVDHINPSLKPKHEEQLKSVANFKKHRDVSEITAFLCVLREIFKQQRAKDEGRSNQLDPGRV